MTLWTASEAVQATGGRSVGDWSATGVSIDTRTLEVGDLFVALKDVRDGHEFVAQALEKGAAAAVVSRVPEGVSGDAPMLIVDDVMRALEALGQAGRTRMVGKVAAVTGSVGKTSTKEMLLAMMSGQGRAHGEFRRSGKGASVRIGQVAASEGVVVLSSPTPGHLLGCASLFCEASPHGRNTR